MSSLLLVVGLNFERLSQCFRFRMLEKYVNIHGNFYILVENLKILIYQYKVLFRRVEL